MALNELSSAPLVRFSVLALSSIFFQVDPFAAIPSFLAITESANPPRRKVVARHGALTCFIVLTSFAVGGQLIFKMFGITLPAFEVAGGLILLLIGLDMLEARGTEVGRQLLGPGLALDAVEEARMLGLDALDGPGIVVDRYAKLAQAMQHVQAQHHLFQCAARYAPNEGRRRQRLGEARQH